MIRSWADLLAALGARDADEVAAIIDERVEGHGRVDADEREHRVVPVVNTRGTHLDYPFPLSDLWNTVDQLDAEVAARDSWASLEESIYAVEGFKVHVFGPEENGDGWLTLEPAPEYPYRRAAKSAMTLARWYATRITPNFSDFAPTPAKLVWVVNLEGAARRRFSYDDAV